MKVRAGPAGIHVFDRATGTNLLIDEARVPPTMWSPTPRSVSVALTNACDLRCPYCYAPKDPGNLDTSRLLAWLNELDFHGCLGIGFGGGEPTLCRDLPELCEYAAQCTELAVTFTTHGHRVDDQLAAKLSGNVHFIRVSMDGVATTYEALRGKSFPALLDRLSIVRQLAPFGVNFVVNRMTVSDLDAAIDIAATHGATEFLLLPEQPVRGQGGIDSRTARTLNAWVTSYEGPLRLAVSEAGSAGLPTCDPLVAERGLRAYAHIDSGGILKRSSYDEYGVPIGSIGVIEALNLLNKTAPER